MADRRHWCVGVFCLGRAGLTMPRKLNLNPPRARILAALDDHPGQYLAVETIAQLAGFEGKSRNALPGYITHLIDNLTIERKRVANPAKGGRTEVWGYRRKQAEDATLRAPSHPWQERRALAIDPASIALARPPRGDLARAPSLSNDAYQAKVQP